MVLGRELESTRVVLSLSLSPPLKPKGLGEDGDHFEETVADVGELPERTGITESGYPFLTGMDYISRGLP